MLKLHNKGGNIQPELRPGSWVIVQHTRKYQGICETEVRYLVYGASKISSL